MEKLLIQQFDHIPTRYFSTAIDFDLKDKIIEKYSGKEWDYPRQLLSETQNITASAVRISEVMKANLDLDLFPMIVKVATKGFDMSGGSAAFLMYSKNAKCYLFDDRAARYKAMKGEYEVSFLYEDTIYRND